MEAEISKERRDYEGLLKSNGGAVFRGGFGQIRRALPGGRPFVTHRAPRPDCLSQLDELGAG
jgi:hypothetical protein